MVIDIGTYNIPKALETLLAAILQQRTSLNDYNDNCH
jgi:hypothetical protein